MERVTIISILLLLCGGILLAIFFDQLGLDAAWYWWVAGGAGLAAFVKGIELR